MDFNGIYHLHNKYKGVSRKIGVYADRIRKYENGVRKPKIDMIENMANIFRCISFSIVRPGNR